MPLAFRWLSPWQERRGDFFFTVGLCFCCRCESLPLLVSNFISSRFQFTNFYNHFWIFTWINYFIHFLSRGSNNNKKETISNLCYIHELGKLYIVFVRHWGGLWGPACSRILIKKNQTGRQRYQIFWGNHSLEWTLINCSYINYLRNI